MALSFSVHSCSKQARTGTLHTTHGDIQTPAFMPVGTAATVKAMLPSQVEETGADIVLGNTYHLMLRPTAERIAKLGGLHRFMQWDKPILTDSGGFQVMSLSSLRKITEEGVRFQSHIDGSKHMLSPERSMEIQHLLGSTITMMFDECTPFPATHEEAKRSMELSMRWGQRSYDAYQQREGYGLFGIVQGGVYADLREQSASILRDIPFDGLAIGGLAVGEGRKLMFETLDVTVPHLPEDKPRYLMGVGKPADMVGAVLRGVDMFDCVLPTRSGRNGQAFTSQGNINIRNAMHAEDTSPLDPNCSCHACTHFSRAYLHHLVKSGEILGSVLMTWHNLTYYNNLMQRLRVAIEHDATEDFVASFEYSLDA